VFTPNWKIVQKLMLQAFLEKGDFCWHCHTGIFSYPMHIAVKFEVPLLFWGEPSAEYTSYYSYEQPEEVDERRFNRFVNLGITADDMKGMIDGSGIEERDLDPFRYPPLRELRRIGVRSVCLGSYIPWDPKTQARLIEDELGWQGDVVEGVPSEYSYEKVECGMQGVRDYIRFLKRGYGRTAHLASLDIRNGRLSRDQGLEITTDHDGKRPASLDLFLDYVGIDEEEFNRVAVSHAVAPWKPDLATIERGQPLPDMARWDRTIELIEKPPVVDTEPLAR
jgi:hypothetical protein